MEESIETHKIMDMDEQKREKLLNAAMAEFRNGFTKASTDAIIRNAGISKGLLYYYFGTKENLYDFLLEYSLDVIMNEFHGLVNMNESDLLERMWQMLLLKMELSYKHPAIFDFVGSAYAQAGAKQSAIAARYLKEGVDAEGLLMRGIDTSLFKDAFDADKVINIIRWAIIGYSDSKIDANKTLDDYRNEYEGYLQDIKEYISILREAFYK